MGTYRQPSIIDEALGLKQANEEISKFNNNVAGVADKIKTANQAVPVISKKSI